MAEAARGHKVAGAKACMGGPIERAAAPPSLTRPR